MTLHLSLYRVFVMNIRLRKCFFRSLSFVEVVDGCWDLICEPLNL